MRLKIGFVLLSLLGSVGCDALVSGAGATIHGNGATTEQKREVALFEEILVSESFETTISIGPTPSVTLMVDENILNMVRTRVLDGRLSVNYVEGPVIVTKKPQKVFIVVPSFDRIIARGASKVMATVFEEKFFRIESEGASAVDVKGLNCENVEVKLDGAARVSIEGKGKSLTLDASGASKLRAAEASYESAKVDLDGASKCEINVTGSISGDLSGACSLSVQGGPTSRSIKVTGASRLTY